MDIFGRGLFDSDNGLFSGGERVYEITGQFGAVGIVALVLGIILWAALMTVIVLACMELIRRYRQPRNTPGASGPPPAPDQPVPEIPGPGVLAILDERYARGEIGRDEYFSRRADLTGLAGQTPQGSVTPQQ